MPKDNKKNTPDRNPSVGTLAIVETQDGAVRLHIDFAIQPETPSELVKRIRSAIVGLSYIYEHDTENVDNVGVAHLDGIEEGIRQMKMADKQKGKVKKDKGYQSSNAGFGANL